MRCPLLWFFPKVTSIIAGSAWVVLFLIVYMNNKMTNFTSSTGILTVEEAETASKYGFYFQMPHASVNLSNGAAIWQKFSFIWLGFLGFHHLWWYMIIPALVILICMYLRPVCHPGVFAEQGPMQY